MNRPKEVFWRQLDLVNIEALMRMDISIIGCGGIGSPTTLALAKMGIEQITVYDKDIIEIHNIPNQLHLVNMIDKPKVDSIKKIVKQLTGVNINVDPTHFEQQQLTEITIVGTDSMSSRKRVFEEFLQQKQAKILIDARMAGNYFNIFYVTKFDKNTLIKYATTILPDDDKNVEEQKCTEKAIIYNTFGIASFICNIIKKVANKEYIPFKYVFDYMSGLLQMFKLEDYETRKCKGRPYVEVDIK